MTKESEIKESEDSVEIPVRQQEFTFTYTTTDNIEVPEK